MKAAFLFPSLLAATQFLVSANAAEPDSAAARDAEIIKRYDTNKDGKLDEAEVAAVKETMLMESQENKEARRERLQERQKSWLEEFDTNKDGKLDEAEKAAMDTTMRARTEKRPQLLKRLDTDGDGKLSDAEWIAGREKIRTRIEEAKGKDKK
ncbi:EF-hand domain-containing protein [Rariglobus hedericola]|uniref:EF-hand domain-containing protein n=1 Tax=Rariglobus hedericola TaxID=2597822 RepID=A0A556QLK0_9BACT|nr:EF-hand domain-containing protein [Rariglobus hedericola]TSJ77526.1 hypothetical protein FPL22_10825 [Rariglobus hedericola]